MVKEYDVAIIGAGTAGLTARAEVAKRTDNYVVLDGGVLGTTCARVGCMPSKTLIEIANTFHKQQILDAYGLQGRGDLVPDYKKVMTRVRSLRDRFAGGVVKGMGAWKQHLIKKNACFMDPNTLDLGDETIRARKVIIAAGSKPVIPGAWHRYRPFLLDTDQFFELETLPRNIAVFGLGPIGIEMGQALSRLGIDVVAITRRPVIGGLTDPDIQNYALQHFSREMNIQLGTADILGETDGKLIVGCNGRSWTVDRVLLGTGRHPFVKGLGLENLGVRLNRQGLPSFDPATLQIENLPVFIAGDVTAIRPILHEAADQGRIAGYNATAKKIQCFEKRTPLKITFSAPNIAVIGRSFADLTEKGTAFVTGETGYDHQGRAIIMGQRAGKVHVYGDQKDGTLLGAELIAPSGEHMAHLVALAIANKMRAEDILSMPFYHPVLEEGLRTAFRSVAKRSERPKPEFEFSRCENQIVG